MAHRVFAKAPDWDGGVKTLQDYKSGKKPFNISYSAVMYV
jgi:hypothetical protein